MAKLEASKSQIDGKGLFSKQYFTKGQHIACITGPIVLIKKFTPKISRETINWIGVSRYRWINTDKSLFFFINHSCDPNVAIKGERTVYALKEIAKSSEITMDYSLTEIEESWNIAKCMCGSLNCRGFIGPITTLRIDNFLKLHEIIPKNFIKIYKSFYKNNQSNQHNLKITHHGSV